MITIVILIILATVTINSVFGENGLIKQAEYARDLSSNSTESELEGMNSLYDEYANVMSEDSEIPTEPKQTATTVAEAKENGLTYKDTTTIKDDLNNDVTIPGGFHIAEDSGTKVEEGVVIEDNIGNQFVWIPVGAYQTTDTDEPTKTNNLSRRVFTETGATEITADNGDGAAPGDAGDYYYGEGNENSVAKEQIEGFKSSSNNNGGFYIGRYEAGTEVERTDAGDELTIPLVQANKNVYVYVTRDESKTQAEAMYSGNEFVISELISSYAWDTALNFICQNSEYGYTLATTIDNTYANIGTGSDVSNRALTGNYTVNGNPSDKYCNIYDLLGNCYEWTTGYSAYNEYNNVGRGGGFDYENNYAASRHNDSIGTDGYNCSFRVQLYIK